MKPTSLALAIHALFHDVRRDFHKHTFVVMLPRFTGGDYISWKKPTVFHEKYLFKKDESRSTHGTEVGGTQVGRITGTLEHSPEIERIEPQHTLFALVP